MHRHFIVIEMFFADQVLIPNENGELTALPFTSEASQAATTDMGMALFKMFITLIALVVLLYASYWFLRRLIQNRMERGVGEKSIQILEKRMISPKTMLYLVAVDNKKILLAESHLEIKGLETFSAMDSETPQKE